MAAPISFTQQSTSLTDTRQPAKKRGVSDLQPKKITKFPERHLFHQADAILRQIFDYLPSGDRRRLCHTCLKLSADISRLSAADMIQIKNLYGVVIEKTQTGNDLLHQFFNNPSLPKSKRDFLVRK